MCSSKTCPRLESSFFPCWRANCPPSKYHQAYQEFTPEIDNGEDFECSKFIPYPNNGEPFV